MHSISFASIPPKLRAHKTIGIKQQNARMYSRIEHISPVVSTTGTTLIVLPTPSPRAPTAQTPCRNNHNWRSNLPSRCRHIAPPRARRIDDLALAAPHTALTDITPARARGHVALSLRIIRLADLPNRRLHHTGGRVFLFGASGNKAHRELVVLN